MAFDLDYFLAQSAMANSNVPRTYLYSEDTDTLATIITDDYFLLQYQVLAAGDIIKVELSVGGFAELVVVSSTSSTVTVKTGGVLELTASAAITPGIKSIELNHATVAVVTTIADSVAHQGFLVIKDTSATGTAAHTVTLTSGTFDGTNNVVTLNALNECIVIYFDSAGNGTIIENVGSVAIS